MSVEPADLVARLAMAAQAAVLNQRPTLSHDPTTLRSITLEIEIDRRGELGDIESFVSRRVSTATILGVSGRAAPMPPSPRCSD